MKRAFVALLAAASLVVSAPASAQTSAADVAAARDLFVEAAKRSSAGDWAGAKDYFERSLKIKRAAITLYSLAIVETHTGNLVEALEHFHAFLTEPSTPATAPYEPLARTAIGELEHKVARCQLVVSPGDAAEIVVTIDGDPVPPAALAVPREVNPGTHVAVATARGMKSGKTPFTVAEGGKVTVELKLQPLAADPLAPPTVVVPVPTPTLGPRLDPTPEPQRKSLTLPIALTAGGAAVLVVGVAVGMVGVKTASGAPTRDGSAASTARSEGIAGDVVATLGGVTAGVGVVLFVLSATRPRAVENARVRVVRDGFVIPF